MTTASRPVRAPAAAAVAAALLLAAGCSVEPAPPRDGELTGVVTSGDDACCLAPAGEPTNGYTALAILSPTDYRRLLAADQPAMDVVPDLSDAGGHPFRFPMSEVVPGNDPADGPVVVPVAGGRWRTPWKGGPALLCLGGTGADDQTGQVLFTAAGCDLLDRAPPVSVTLRVELGGVGMAVAG